MTINSPKFNLSIVIISHETSNVNIQVEKINVDIVVLQTPAKDFIREVTRPQGALSETEPPLVIMKANKEVSKIREQQQDAYVTRHLIL